MEPEYERWLRENMPKWYEEMRAAQEWQLEWRDKEIGRLRARLKENEEKLHPRVHDIEQFYQEDD